MTTFLIIYGVVAVVALGVMFFFAIKNGSIYDQNKDNFDLPFGDDDNPKKINKMQILRICLVAIAWPIVLPILAIAGIVQAINNRRKQKELERKKRNDAEVAHKRNELFANSTPLVSDNTLDGCVNLWRKIVALTEAEKYDQIFDNLNEITTEDRYSLKIGLCKQPQEGEYFIGDDSYLYVEDKNGNKDRDIFTHLNTTETQLGVWQIFILHKLWHILPHFWHGGYNYRTFVFDKQDLQKVVEFVNEDEMSFDVSLDVSMYDVAPIITQNVNIYYVSYCYWNDWEGLVREVVEITINNGKVVDVHELNKNVLFEYDCGILF